MALRLWHNVTILFCRKQVQCACKDRQSASARPAPSSTLSARSCARPARRERDGAAARQAARVTSAKLSKFQLAIVLRPETERPSPLGQCAMLAAVAAVILQAGRLREVGAPAVIDHKSHV
jgi:hypothetical protein